MHPGEHPLRVALKPQYKYYNHTIHQASEEIISQRIALKSRLYIHIIIVTIHRTHNVSPWRTAVTDNCVGLCFRSTPDYAWLAVPDYFRTTSGLLRSARPDTGVLSTSPEGRPGPGGSHLLDFCLPCAGSVHLSRGCRIRAGFPYIQWRGLLPIPIGDLSSQATKS